MDGLKRISSTVEYIYDTKDVRDKHISLMKKEGWQNISGSTERTRKSEGHKWYACFTRKY